MPRDKNFAVPSKGLVGPNLWVDLLVKVTIAVPLVWLPRSFVAEHEYSPVFGVSARNEIDCEVSPGMAVPSLNHWNVGTGLAQPKSQVRIAVSPRP